MKLPNAENAVIDPRKLSDYTLNLDHDRGKHKARLFFAIFGLGIADVEELETAILAAIMIYGAIATDADDYGVRYIRPLQK
jgi:hypothetical protein